MGGPMASRLIDAGYRLIVFDTSSAATDALAARGAQVAASAAEVASAAPIVFLSLPTPNVVETVALSPGGLLSGTAVRIVVDVSTTGPGIASKVARGLAERDVTYVDSPVSGGIAGATKGTLAVMVACPKDTYEEVQPLLQNFGKTFYTGEKAGLAQTAKLANNLLAAAAMVVSSEAVVMGVKAGLDPKVLIDIINAGSGRNSATQDKFPRAVLTRSFDFGFAWPDSALGAFKAQWGAEPVPEYCYVQPPRTPGAALPTGHTEPRGAGRLAARALGRSPLALTRLLGTLAYRYA